MCKSILNDYNYILEAQDRMDSIAEKLGMRLFRELQRIEGFSNLVDTIQPKFKTESLEVKLRFLLQLLNIPPVELTQQEVKALVKYRNTIVHFNQNSLAGKSYLDNWERTLVELERLNEVFHKYCIRTKVGKEQLKITTRDMTLELSYKYNT